MARYGQGGSGYCDKDWPYHNSFLVADRAVAFLIETSDRNWAVRQIRDVGSASNHLSIGTDWDSLSDGAPAPPRPGRGPRHPQLSVTPPP